MQLITYLKYLKFPTPHCHLSSAVSDIIKMTTVIRMIKDAEDIETTFDNH